MFSRRTRWSLAENAISRAVETSRESGRELIDLTETNPTRVGLPYPEEQIRRALSDGPLLTYAPASFGLHAAREAVARYHDERVPSEHICLTASTSEAYGWLFKLLCDPGETVLVPSPGYPLFDYLAALESVQLAPYRTRRWDDWSIDFDQLESQLTGTTRAIVLVSPNNPTGAMLHTTDLPRLVDVCRRHGLALICDEVFAEYAAPRPDRVPTLAGFNGVLTFVLSGLSKSCLLPQMKAGWIAVSGPEEHVRDALARLEVIADSYLSVSTPAQLALSQFLALRDQVQAPLKARLRANLGALTESLRGGPATVLPSDGGWSAVIRVPATRSEEAWVLSLLERAGVLVHPGFFFDFEEHAFLVVSLIPEEARFAQAAARLSEQLAS